MDISCQLHAPVVLHPEKEHWFPLNGRLVGPQRRSGSFGEEKNPFLLPGFDSNPQIVTSNVTKLRSDAVIESKGFTEQ